MALPGKHRSIGNNWIAHIICGNFNVPLLFNTNQLEHDVPPLLPFITSSLIGGGYIRG